MSSVFETCTSGVVFWVVVDIILFDLGISVYHYKISKRGFPFFMSFFGGVETFLKYKVTS